VGISGHVRKNGERIKLAPSCQLSKKEVRDASRSKKQKMASEGTASTTWVIVGETADQ
jgi:hypothetical protein